MLPIQIGIADRTGKVENSLLVAVAAAINVQVTRDLTQYWNIRASVQSLQDPRRIPQGMWPVFLVDRLPPHEGGFHLTHHNQPYSKVLVSAGETWSIDASHEILEMLVDPFGNRLQAAGAIGVSGSEIVDVPGKFEYLVEACDPCEANEFGYPINSVLVSDFLTPHFYDRAAAPDARYSFTGAIKKPRQVLDGGYITWVDPNSDHFMQLRNFDSAPEIRDLGPAQGNSIRQFVDARTRSFVSSKKQLPLDSIHLVRSQSAERADEAAVARGRHYNE